MKKKFMKIISLILSLSLILAIGSTGAAAGDNAVTDILPDS